MPRLLPRLIKWLERNPPSHPDYRGPLTKPTRRRHSLWKPTPSPDVLEASFSLKGRRNSLLLDHENIITSPRVSARHKRLPPTPRLQKNQVASEGDHESPREMTEQEKQWWSSPYLRMLASPLRSCMVSDKVLPSDFLIRLIGVRFPKRSRRGEVLGTIIPNGILHPRFTTRLFGAGGYVTCWDEAMKALVKNTSLFKRTYVNMPVHSLLLKQISHQLRLRVLQEVDILAARLSAAPHTTADNPFVRRLTRTEWMTLKSMGRIPWKDVSCILIVPPVNKDPITKQRPTPNFTTVPPEISELEPTHTRKDLPPLPPVSTLHLIDEGDYEELPEFLGDNHLPHARVPLYNGLSLMPLRSQRTALHEKLCEVLEIERRTRWRHGKSASTHSRGDKPSHAFAIFSSSKTVERADTVPLAISLWRVRMWGGGGMGECDWKSSEETEGGW